MFDKIMCVKYIIKNINLKLKNNKNKNIYSKIKKLVKKQFVLFNW